MQTEAKSDTTENAAPNPWLEEPGARSWQETVEALDVSPEQGLDTPEVRRRRKRYGPNRLRATESKSAWRILVEQFKSLIVLLLVAAAALSFAFGDWVEGTAIVAVILINAAIGFVTELRAVRSMEALQRLGSVSAKVRRERQIREVAAEKLVLGDIVPGLSNILRLARPGADGWILVAAASVVPLVIGQILKQDHLNWR